MPSIKYKMTEKLFFHTVKSIMGDSRMAFVDYVFSMAKKRKLEVPSSRWQAGYIYEETEDGETTLIKLASKKSPHDALVLYLTGDGLFQPPALADFELCGDLADHTKRDIWLLSYPLIPSAGPAAIMECVLHTYEQALEHYAPERIAVMGLSSGCLTAMGICFELLKKGRGEMLPQLLLLQSPPLRIPPSEEQMAQMREIENRDCVFTADYYEWLSYITDYGDLGYFTAPLDLDMRGFPEIFAFFGEYETASTYAEELQEKCGKDGVKLSLQIGEKMMHNWCLLGNTPEAAAVRRRFYEILTFSV